MELETMVDQTKNITKYSICVKLRSFQFRLIMNALITNLHLYKYGILQSPDCTFCEQETETIKHLFVDCNHVKLLWNFVKEKYKLTELTAEAIILNNAHKNLNHPLNSIVLMVKYYVYRTRCLKERLSAKSCENYIRSYINVEEMIAKSKDKLDLHKNKWSEFI